MNHLPGCRADVYPAYNAGPCTCSMIQQARLADSLDANTRAMQDMESKDATIDALRAENARLLARLESKRTDHLCQVCNGGIYTNRETITQGHGDQQKWWHSVCFVVAERDKAVAENARLRDVLEWLDRCGGLGLDKHERIRAAIKENTRGE